MCPIRESSARWRSRGFAAAVITLAMVAPGNASATTINVSTTADELLSAPDNGNCVLREALAAAETNAAVDACSAGEGFPTRDTVSLAPGTYPVTGASGEDANGSGDLDVEANATASGPGFLTIDGTDAGVVIDALAGNGQDDRVIDLRSGILELSDLSVTGGRVIAPGGGIRVAAGILNLSNATITDNQALGGDGGGIWAAPSASAAGVDVSNSRITQNVAQHLGGGIRTGANEFLSMSDSVISGNQLINNNDGSDTQGGGISVVDLSSIEDSTISGNTVSVGAPSGVATPAGAGIAIASTTSDRGTILNTTITGNQATDARTDQALSPAGGGIYSSGPGELFVVNSTIVGNTVSGDAPGGASTAWGGGGLFTGSTSETLILSSTVAGNEAPVADALARFFGGGIRLQNSIVDDHDGVVTDTCGYNTGGFLATNGHNVAMGTTCVDGVTDPTDLAATNPQLGALGSFGGPTQTILPADSSPAIDLVPVAACDDGDGGTLAEDQRHLLRPFDFAADATADCDAGAVERRPGEIAAGSGGGGAGAAPGAAPASPSNAFAIGKLIGRTLSLIVPGPGVVDVSDAKGAAARAAVSAAPKLLKHSRAKATAAGKVKVKLKLTRKGKSKLADRGRVRVRASITFTPTGGSPGKVTKKFKIKS